MRKPSVATQRNLRVFVLILLAGSIALNVFLFISAPRGNSSYLQTDEQIYIMEAGILKRNQEFSSAADATLRYEFTNEDYRQLLSDYSIERIAGDGSEFEQAVNLMNAFSDRLTHKSDYDNHVEMNALSLLSYSLDNKAHGINCKSKAQILNEMCLALGIYARKVWILPNSEYDNDCHVVNEVWDTTLEKWVMLDITNNEYWIDENRMPLSVLEIRQKGAEMAFCTPVKPGENTDDVHSLKETHMSDFLYIMKNIVSMEYCKTYTTGETERYVLLPVSFTGEMGNRISEMSVTRSPLTDQGKEQ